jgi:hypothetical protein
MQVHTGSTNDLLMLSLSKFYAQSNYIEEFIPIVNGESEISLRLIDWFVTNFSKKNNTILVNVVDGNTVHMNVFMSYRSQLKSYSKTNFDPFRRRDRIRFYYGGNGYSSTINTNDTQRAVVVMDTQKTDVNKDTVGYIDTTIGQLNMFRWILQHNILEYIRKHKEDIESDMINAQRENQKKKLNKDNIKVKVVETENGTITTTRKKRNELSKSIMKNMNRLEGSRVLQFD